MFNNPFFKSEERPSMIGRPSIQDVMQKYSIQSRQHQPASSYDPIERGRASQQHLSPSNQPLFSETSMMSEQEGQAPSYQEVREFPPLKFQNPLQFTVDYQRQEASRNLSHLERVTFGQNSQKRRSPSPIPVLSVPKDNSKQPAEEELYDEMQSLKEKVLGMLQRYSTNVQNPDNRKDVKKRLKQDAKSVAAEYSQIIEKFNNQSDLSGLTDLSCISANPKKVQPNNSQQEQELHMMFNLVDEFLCKFQGERSRNSPGSYQNLLQTRMQKSGVHQKQRLSYSDNRIDSPEPATLPAQRPPIPKPSITSTSTIKEKIINPMRASTLSHSHSQESISVPTPQFIPSNRSVSPVKKSPQIPKVSVPFSPKESPNLDMTVLPQFPQTMEDSFYSDKKMSLERLNRKLSHLQAKLTRELENENLPFTKIILTEMIENLNKLVAIQDEQLAKTIAFKIEQGIEQIKLSQQGSLKLYHYLNKAIRHSTQKMEQIKGTRYSEPLPQRTLQFEQAATRRTEQVIPDQHKQLSVKRQFFDMALQLKHALPKSHPGNNLMVSELYDHFVAQMVPLHQMENFINQELARAITRPSR